MMRLFIITLLSLLLYGCDSKDKTCLASDDVDGSMTTSADNELYSASQDIIRYYNSNGILPENATDDDAYVGSWKRIDGQDSRPFRVYTDSEVHVVADGSVYLSGRYAHVDLHTTHSLMAGVSYPIVKVKPKFYAKDNLVIFTSGALHRCKTAQDALSPESICDVVPTSEILSVYVQPDVNINGQKKAWQDETRWGCYMGNTMSYIDNYSCDPITGQDCSRSLTTQESEILCSSKTGMGCKHGANATEILPRLNNINNTDIHSPNYVVCTDNIQRKETTPDTKEVIGWSDYDMSPSSSPMKGVYQLGSCEAAPVSEMVSEYGGLIKYIIYTGNSNARTSQTICNTSFTPPKRGVPIVSYIGTIPTAAQGTNKHAMSIAAPLANSYNKFNGSGGPMLSYWKLFTITAAAMAPTSTTSECAGWMSVGGLWEGKSGNTIAGEYFSNPANANNIMKNPIRGLDTSDSSYQERTAHSALYQLAGRYDGWQNRGSPWDFTLNSSKYKPSRFLYLYSENPNHDDILNLDRCKGNDTAILSNIENVVDLGVPEYNDNIKSNAPEHDYPNKVMSIQNRSFEDSFSHQSCSVGIDNLTSIDVPMDGGWHVIPSVLNAGATYKFNSGAYPVSTDFINEKAIVTKLSSPITRKAYNKTDSSGNIGSHAYDYFVDTSEQYNSSARSNFDRLQHYDRERMDFWAPPMRSEKTYQYFYPERRQCANAQYYCKNYNKSGSTYVCNDTMSVRDIVRIYGNDISNLRVCFDRGNIVEYSNCSNDPSRTKTISSLSDDTIIIMDKKYVFNLPISILLYDETTNKTALYCNANGTWYESGDLSSITAKIAYLNLDPYTPDQAGGTLRRMFYTTPYPSVSNLFANHEKPKQCGLGMATKMYYGKILACVNGYESKCTDERFSEVKCLSGTSCAGKNVCGMTPTNDNNGVFGTCTAMVHGYNLADSRLWEKHYLLDFFSNAYDNMHSSSSSQRLSLNKYIADKINTQCDGSSCLSNKYVEGIGNDPINSFPLGVGVQRQVVGQNQCGICMQKAFNSSEIATNSSMKLLVIADGKGQNQQACIDNGGSWVTNFSIQSPNFLSISDKADIQYANVSYVWSNMQTMALCKDNYDQISYKPIPGTDYNLFRSFNDIDFDLSGKLTKDADDTDIMGGFRQNRDAFINSITIPNNISSANLAFSIAGELPVPGNNGLKFIKRNEKISIDLASGWPVKNGRYMYIYIQPLYSGPSYDAPLYRDKYGLDTRMTPGKLFPTKRSLWAAIRNSDSRLISFDSIAGGSKSGSFVAASNGAMWTVVADLDGDTSINDHDGIYLDQETQTINGGHYIVKARTKSGQAVSGIMSFISGAGNGLIDIVKTIFFGPAEQACTTICQMDQISQSPSTSIVSTQSPSASGSDLLTSFPNANTSVSSPTTIVSATDTMIQQMSQDDFALSQSYYNANKTKDKIEVSYKCDIEVSTQVERINYGKFSYCEYVSATNSIDVKDNTVMVLGSLQLSGNTSIHTTQWIDNGVKYNITPIQDFFGRSTLKKISFGDTTGKYKNVDGIESYNLSVTGLNNGGDTCYKMTNYMQDDSGQFGFQQISPYPASLSYNVNNAQCGDVQDTGFGMLNSRNIKAISLIYDDTDYYNNSGSGNFGFKIYRPLKAANLYNEPTTYIESTKVDISSTCPSILYNVTGSTVPKVVDISNNYNDIPDIWFGYKTKTYENLHNDIKNLFKEDVTYTSYQYKCSLVEKGTSNEVMDYKILSTQIKDDADQDYLKLPMKYNNCSRSQCSIYKINVTPAMSKNPSSIKKCIYRPVTDTSCWIDTGKIVSVPFESPIIANDDYTINSVVGNVDYTNKIVCDDTAKSCKVNKLKILTDNNGNVLSSVVVSGDITDYITPENVIKINNTINRSGKTFKLNNTECSDMSLSNVNKLSMKSNNFVSDIDNASQSQDTNKLPMKYGSCSNGKCNLFKIKINDVMRMDPSIIRKCIYQPITDQTCWTNTGSTEDISSRITVLNSSGSVDYTVLGKIVGDNDYSLSSFVDNITYTSKIVCDTNTRTCTIKKLTASTDYLGYVTSTSESSNNVGKYFEPDELTSINNVINRASSQSQKTSVSTILSRAESKSIYNIFSLNQNEANGKYEFKEAQQIQNHVLCQARSTVSSSVQSGIDALKYVGSTSSVSSNCTNLVRVCNGSYQNWEKGLIYKIFSGISGSALYQALFYMFVILYVTITGYEFIQGTTNFAKTDHVIKEGIKFGIIIMLSSPSGWEFYLNYFVKNAIIFSEYMNRIAVESLLGDSSAVGFAFKPISYPIDFIFNWMTLVRLVSLIFSGTFILGLITFFVILFSFMSIFFYALRAIVLYISSIMVMSIYFSIVHLVIIGRMFKATEDWFDKWIAAIVTAVAEQFMLFTSLSLYCALISSILESMMSFKVCYRPILVIPLYDWTAGIIDDIPLAYGPKPEATNAPRLLPSDEFDFSSFSESMQSSVVPDVMTAFKISALSMLGMKMTEYIKGIGKDIYGSKMSSMGGFKSIADTFEGLSNLNTATFDAGNVFTAANKAVETTSRLGSRANQWLQKKIKQNTTVKSDDNIDSNGFDEGGSNRPNQQNPSNQDQQNNITDAKDTKDNKDTKDKNSNNVNNGYEDIDGDDMSSLFDEGEAKSPAKEASRQIIKNKNDDDNALIEAGNMFKDEEQKQEKREARKNNKNAQKNNQGFAEGVEDLMNNEEKRSKRADRKKVESYEDDLSDIFDEEDAGGANAARKKIDGDNNDNEEDK